MLPFDKTYQNIYICVKTNENFKEKMTGSLGENKSQREKVTVTANK
jgi:hypothetical protein